MLRKISLHGFKSFCDRTEILLGSGITAIVGPNGCGKSNLADAIRWVLGEQNPRILRCGRLSDLVFSGTLKRKAMGMAEVDLFLDGLPSETELQVKRRYAKDGTGDYHINGKVCRWKDVIDMFLGTGLSHQGYVVIGQGMIHELVGGKPQDRRLWIEEASGVARYKQDKRHIEDQIDQAKANIIRLSDLLTEISAQKEKLELEASLTRKHNALLAEKDRLEAFLALRKMKDDEKKVLGLKQKIEDWESQVSESRQNLASFQAERSLVSESLEPLRHEAGGLAKERETILARLLALEKERDAARAKLTFALKELESRRIRMAVLGKDLGRVDLEIGQIAQKKEELDRKAAAARQDLSSREEELREKEGSWRQLGESVISLRGQMVELTGNLGSLAKEKESLRKIQESIEKDLAVEESHLSGLKNALLTGQEERDSLEEELRRHLFEKDQKDSLIGEIAAKLKSQEVILADARSKAKDLETRMSFMSARKRLLQDMRDTYEGYAKSTRSILEASRKAMLSGILGVPGELFSSEPKYVKALSSALGGASEYIIVKDEKAAKAGIEYLRKTRSGRCTFLPLDLLRPRDLHPKTVSALKKTQSVKPLLSLVKCDESVEKASRYLLGRVLLAEDHDSAVSFMRSSSFTARVVTLSGESFDPGGTITGGDAERHESIFQRKKELDSLLEEEPRVRQLLEKAQEEMGILEGKVSDLSDSLEKLNRERAWEETRITQVHGSLSQNQALMEDAKKKAQDSLEKTRKLKEKSENLEEALQVVSSKEKEISGQISALERDLGRREETLRNHLLGDSGTRQALNEATRIKESLERELSSVSIRLEGLSSEKSSLERNLSDEEKETQRLKSFIEELERNEDSLGEEIQKAEKNLGSLKGVLAEKSCEIESKEARLSFLNGEIVRLSREIDHLGVRLEEGKRGLLGLEAALKETFDLAMHKYGQIDRDALGDLDITREEALSRVSEIESSVSQLGNVNLKAEEELKTFEERLATLEREKKDVMDAVDHLEEAKIHVEGKIREVFLETFQEVSVNFSDIFQRLFGGGSGQLLLDDSLGVEITCQVPGRRGKDLNLLSGGERSLAGIALVFSILRAKPSPLIVLDEVDAALDGANVVRFSQFLKSYAEHTQFIVITHKEATMESADVVYGVTMEEPGVSKVFSMRVESMKSN